MHVGECSRVVQLDIAGKRCFLKGDSQGEEGDSILIPHEFAQGTDTVRLAAHDQIRIGGIAEADAQVITFLRLRIGHIECVAALHKGEGRETRAVAVLHRLPDDGHQAKGGRVFILGGKRDTGEPFTLCGESGRGRGRGDFLFGEQ